jgi:hypothetical protein
MESVCIAAPGTPTTPTNPFTSAPAPEPYRRASYTGQLPYVDTGTQVFDIDWYSLTSEFPKGKAERKGRAWRPNLRNKGLRTFSYSEDHATAIKAPEFEAPLVTSSLVENTRVESPVVDTLEWIFIPVHEDSKDDSGRDTPPLSDTTSMDEFDSWDWIPLDFTFLIDDPVHPESSIDCVVHTVEDDLIAGAQRQEAFPAGCVG